MRSSNHGPEQGIRDRAGRSGAARVRSAAPERDSLLPMARSLAGLVSVALVALTGCPPPNADPCADSTCEPCNADPDCLASERCIEGLCIRSDGPDRTRDDGPEDSGARPADGGDDVPLDSGAADGGDAGVLVDAGDDADSGATLDAGHDGGGFDDAGLDDAGSDDAGSGDAGSEDAGSEDAGSEDAGSEDAGIDDAGSDDAGLDDAGLDDAGIDDAGIDDAGIDDAGLEDAGIDDAGLDEDGGVGPGLNLDRSFLRAQSVGTANGLNFIGVRVHLEDDDGVPVAGQTLTLTSASGGVRFGDACPPTDEDGDASCTAAIAATIPGTKVVSVVEVAGLHGEVSFQRAVGLVARGCGFDLNRDGRRGEAGDCGVCAGLDVDIDGDALPDPSFYVDLDAAPGGDGTAAAPFSTMSAAFAAVDAGAAQAICVRGQTDDVVAPDTSGAGGRYWLEDVEVPLAPLLIAGWDSDADGVYPPLDPDDLPAVFPRVSLLSSAGDGGLEVAHVAIEHNVGSLRSVEPPADPILAGFQHGRQWARRSHVVHPSRS